MQIANELAARVGSDLLLNHDQPDEDLLRACCHRLLFASNVIRGRFPGFRVPGTQYIIHPAYFLGGRGGIPGL